MPQLSRLESYADGLERAVACAPGQALVTLLDQLAADPCGLLGEAMVLWRLQRYGDALTLLDGPSRDSCQNDPQYWVLVGMAARQLAGHHQRALQAYQCALELAPQRADIHYNLGNLLQDTDPAAAEIAYLQSLLLDPMQAPCWHNLAMVYQQADRFLEAVGAHRNSLKLDPTVPDVWCNLGLALLALDHHGPAQRCFTHAISLDHSHGASHTNMGTALIRQALHPEQALAFLQRGVELQQSSADSLWNLALADLLLGNYRRGWDYYEARLQTKFAIPHEVPSAGSIPASLDDCPKAGDPPLLVWSEQGLGDAIQFGRYLPLLEAAGVPYELRCRPPLARLFRDWFGLGDRVRVETGRTDAIDTRPHCPLLSLPRLFRTELITVPSVLPYLHPPAAAPAHLQVPPPPGGIAVGLVWAANASNTVMYRHKSIPLALLMPRLLDLVDLDLIELHALQVGPDASQLDPWRHHPRLTDWSPLLHDFADTAHVVRQLDLVITVDTAVAHLAGALNRPCWVLLPRNGDFRWLRERSDSPWYPGCMRLFRQQAHGDWSSVVQQLKEAWDALTLFDLDALVAAKLH